MKENRKNSKGITLIALIITIILLLILAGVTIHFTLGENGILRNAEVAGKKYSEATVKETIQNILADMQMEEIKNGNKLDLAKVAQNLASKDSNITIIEYEEGASELKGTYTINGQEYEFIINNKFEVEVSVSTGEKIVRIKEITWENGKPKVELTSGQEGTIEYKDTDGTWKPYDESVNLNNGDTLTVRVNTGSGTTKEETIVIKDKTVPSEFEIEITSENIKSKSVTVNLKTIPQDKETGLKDYTYVAEGNESKKEVENITSTTYTITELEPEIKYKVYVLAFDNAGNYRKSNVIEITTLSYTPPTTNVGTTHATGHNLDNPNGGYYYSWEEIAELAEIISNDNRASITYTTPEVTIVKDEKTYTLGAGDYKNVTYNGVAKRVRILGFNHDTLASTDAYGEGTANTYAGISFEFVDFLDEKSGMNESRTENNVGGWAACKLRTKILTKEETINKISIGGKIKEVVKLYNAGSGVWANKSCVDKLWLLACSEIWTNGISGMPYGLCNTKEGEQYEFYKLNVGTALCTSRYNSALLKPVVSQSSWWLRSPDCKYNQGFNYVYTKGDHGWGYFDCGCQGVAPGFCI